MRFVGVDLHQQTITVVVVDAARKLLARKRFSNLMSEQIVSFLKTLDVFQLTLGGTGCPSSGYLCGEARRGLVAPT